MNISAMDPENYNCTKVIEKVSAVRDLSEKKHKKKKKDKSHDVDVEIKDLIDQEYLKNSYTIDHTENNDFIGKTRKKEKKKDKYEKINFDQPVESGNIIETKYVDNEANLNSIPVADDCTSEKKSKKKKKSKSDHLPLDNNDLMEENCLDKKITLDHTAAETDYNVRNINKKNKKTDKVDVVTIESDDIEDKNYSNNKSILGLPIADTSFTDKKTKKKRRSHAINEYNEEHKTELDQNPIVYDISDDIIEEKTRKKKNEKDIDQVPAVYDVCDEISEHKSRDKRKNRNLDDVITELTEQIPSKKKKKDLKDLDSSAITYTDVSEMQDMPEGEAVLSSENVITLEDEVIIKETLPGNRDNLGHSNDEPRCFEAADTEMKKSKRPESLLNPSYLLNTNRNVDSMSPSKVNGSFHSKHSNRNERETHQQRRDSRKNTFEDCYELIPCLPKGCTYTVSIAVPASILAATILRHDLRTYVIGQIARTACIYAVDEIVVYNDRCWRTPENEEYAQDYMGMMRMVLEYQECPQYLRRYLFPNHEYLRHVGILNALNAPHHLRSEQWCTYREGIILEETFGKCSYVDAGLQKKVEVDQKLQPGLRVTIKFPPESRTTSFLYGTIVSPQEPRQKGGLYWGYTVRMANSLSEVFHSDRFKDGYDLIIGTSDKGNNVHTSILKPYSHALIIFGGVDGLEAAINADKSIQETDPMKLFQYYLNTCPSQQSRTIRTEEAVLITLSMLSDKLKECGTKSNNT